MFSLFFLHPGTFGLETSHDRTVIALDTNAHVTDFVGFRFAWLVVRFHFRSRTYKHTTLYSLYTTPVYFKAEGYTCKHLWHILWI